MKLADEVQLLFIQPEFNDVTVLLKSRPNYFICNLTKRRESFNLYENGIDSRSSLGKTWYDEDIVKGIRL